MKVDFKFSLDEKVENRLEELGIITMLAVDDGGRVYYVHTKNYGAWIKESSLKKAKK